jgi:hypothetical protein
MRTQKDLNDFPKSWRSEFRDGARTRTEFDLARLRPYYGWSGLLPRRFLLLEVGGSPVPCAHLPALDEHAFALRSDLGGLLSLRRRWCGSGVSCCFRRRRFTAAARECQAHAEYHHPPQQSSDEADASVHVLNTLPPLQVDALDGRTDRGSECKDLPIPTCLFETSGENLKSGAIQLTSGRALSR